MMMRLEKSVSIDVRLMERKDMGYFHNSKMFNKKNISTSIYTWLNIYFPVICMKNKIEDLSVCFYEYCIEKSL